eukprot:m.23248 g.23248  ORF g.23248 m.23248 type:complete len:383 (-) comp14136_c0_seq1:61-1209(-)
MPNHLFHPGPIGTMVLIAIISATTIKCLLRMGWNMHLIVFVAEVTVIFFSYLRSVHLGGGFVEKEWKPKDDQNRQRLQFCTICKGYKAPRTHHCHTCNRCVKRMDHHCPWINACVGHDNLGAFICFTTSVPVGAGHATYIQICYLFSKYFASLRYLLSFSCLVMLSTGLSIAMIIGAGLIGAVQWFGIVRNQTQVELWIMKKTTFREREDVFLFPYDLGWRQNLKQFFNNAWQPDDGISWETKEGSTLYSLSEEQLAQKAEKYAFASINLVTKTQSKYNPCCRFGCKLFCCRSWMDPFISVKEGDIIRCFHNRNGWAWGEVCDAEIIEGLDRDDITAMRNANPGVSIQYFNNKHVVKAKFPRERGRFPIVCIQKEETEKKTE